MRPHAAGMTGETREMQELRTSAKELFYSQFEGTGFFSFINSPRHGLRTLCQRKSHSNKSLTKIKISDIPKQRPSGALASRGVRGISDILFCIKTF